MADQNRDVPSCSKSIYQQRIKNATDLKLLLGTPERTEIPSDSSSDDEMTAVGGTLTNEQSQSDAQANIDVRSLFNCTNNERAWVFDVLQENISDNLANTQPITHSEIHSIVGAHKTLKKESRYGEVRPNEIYYGVGLFSAVDKYPEIVKMPVRLVHASPSTCRVYSGIQSAFLRQNAKSALPSTSAQHQKQSNTTVQQHTFAQPHPVPAQRKRTRKFKDDETKKKWEDVMTIKRKKVFSSLVKKEVGKHHRSKVNKHKDMLIQCKRAALQCQKFVRQKALKSSRVVKEQQWRMKRLSRENLAYWKRSKRVDREIRRKLEKEAEEQRKIDFEFVEAKRQQRKLNFLITQTELYAHFMSKKLGTGSTEEQLRILSQLDEEKIPRLASIDDYDCDAMKLKAIRNAENAFQFEKARTRDFDIEANSTITVKKILSDGERLQPILFHGNLKGYQLRGMNWLANLYDQGISGILADEMGLGKTVQSIAFLCHIAESYSVWGPFLIISPASTLHNWQQELEKFVPDFKVVPYWGSPNERKILRQFWDQKDMHTRDASFHIVVTSYQIVIADIKYFNRIKWQYMILDEAQAIKSTNSMRWKTLLGFTCRNRLLLSGTPIQNSMAELWALLHFIMPTLFDSHEEFNEWFSKDIESHAENKTGIDEKHLSRLHMILKPFMLRRIKKDVENELSDKIEVMVYCPLTTRQRLLYMALKQKIKIEDLLHYTVGGGDSHAVDKNFTSNLMNLVMQFRKVCNHPELFERRDAKSPIYTQPHLYQIPYVVYDLNVKKEKMYTIQKYLFFTVQYIHQALSRYFNETIFNIASTLNLSAGDMYNIFLGDIAYRWRTYFEMQNFAEICFYRMVLSQDYKTIPLGYISALFKMSPANINASPVLKDLVFVNDTTGKCVFYTHTLHLHYSMAETAEHNTMRSNTSNIEYSNTVDVIDEVPMKFDIKEEELPYLDRIPDVYECKRTSFPSFLFCAMPKVETLAPNLYCYSRRAAWDWKRFIDDYSWNSLDNYCSLATRKHLPKHNMYICQEENNPFNIITPVNGWSHITIPDKETLVTDSGKLFVLDGLLKRLKEEGHRVLIYSQMTKMIDLLEEYMWHRHHTYMRLDGSSKISERRDMVADFQARTDIFVFLLSTRAGGLGINLTAADTVIFYDSDWNPTVDQQAMDRAHRLGQTKQVTVYRLICKGSIEERILERAREKSEIQKLVISGGNFKPDTLKPKEVVSLLLDDEEIEMKYRQRTEERKHLEDMRELEKKQKYLNAVKAHLSATEAKRIKGESPESGIEDQWLNVDSGRSSSHSDNSPILTGTEDLSDGSFLDVEGDLPVNNKYTVYNLYGSAVKQRHPGRGASKRGRPRGSRRFSALGRFNSSNTANSVNSPSTTTFCPPSLELPIDLNVSSSSSVLSGSDSANPPSSVGSFGSPSSGYSSVSVSSRRGPGRPRIKPNGSAHSGARGPYRPRKPARPLPVPLHSGVRNSVYSVSGVYSHYYGHLDQQPSDT